MKINKVAFIRGKTIEDLLLEEPEERRKQAETAAEVRFYIRYFSRKRMRTGRHAKKQFKRHAKKQFKIS
jgi:hypothetical protein